MTRICSRCGLTSETGKVFKTAFANMKRMNLCKDCRSATKMDIRVNLLNRAWQLKKVRL